MKLENYKSDEPCLACGESRDGYVCFHHLITQKNLGPDSKWNLMPVCLKHHNMVHGIGLTNFINKFPRVEQWLLSNDWKYVLGKWRHFEQEHPEGKEFRSEGTRVSEKEWAFEAS